jgi:hypothetical protein
MGISYRSLALREVSNSMSNELNLKKRLRLNQSGRFLDGNTRLPFLLVNSSTSFSPFDFGSLSHDGRLVRSTISRAVRGRHKMVL